MGKEKAAFDPFPAWWTITIHFPNNRGNFIRDIFNKKRGNQTKRGSFVVVLKT